MNAKTPASLSVDALVFDAYGTLFDVDSVAVLAEQLFGGHGLELARLWRAKQLEYTWLQSLMRSKTRPREDFAAVTALALDYAAEALRLALPPAMRHRLLDSYLDLAPFPEAAVALAALAPLPRIVLSNGTPGMLEPLIASSGLGLHLDAVLSVDAAGIFKPSPRVYQLAVERLGLPAFRIGFVSSNGWDAIGAKAFGMTVVWINRASAPVDRHGPAPDAMLSSLAELPALVRS